MKKGEEFFEEQLEILPELYKSLLGEDDEGKDLDASNCKPTTARGWYLTSTV